MLLQKPILKSRLSKEIFHETSTERYNHSAVTVLGKIKRNFWFSTNEGSVLLVCGIGSQNQKDLFRWSTETVPLPCDICSTCLWAYSASLRELFLYSVGFTVFCRSAGSVSLVWGICSASCRICSTSLWYLFCRSAGNVLLASAIYSASLWLFSTSLRDLFCWSTRPFHYSLKYLFYWFVRSVSLFRNLFAYLRSLFR